MVNFLWQERPKPPIPLHTDECTSYARKSTIEERSPQSIEDQNAANMDTAEEWSIPLAPEGVLSEKPGLGGNLWWEGYIRSGLEGDDAKRQRTRPILTNIMNGVVTGRIKCIVIWSQDRLWRDVALCKVMIDILGEKGCLLYDKNGPVDVSTSEGRAAVLCNAVASQKAREKAAEDSPRGINRKLKKGERVITANVLGFRCVSGNRKTLRHVPEEQEMVRRIFRLFDSGEGDSGPQSPQQIALRLMAESYKWMPDLWNTRGVKRTGPTEDVIYTLCVSKVLEDCRYQGRQRRKDNKAGTEREWQCPTFLVDGEPVVSTALYERVQAKMNGLKRGANATRSSYPLASLIRCGVCGQTMYAGRTAIVQHGISSSETAWIALRNASWCWCTHKLPVIQHKFLDDYMNMVLAPLLLAEVKERACEGGVSALVNERAGLTRALTEAERRYHEELPEFVAECFRKKMSPHIVSRMQEELEEEIHVMKAQLRSVEQRMKSHDDYGVSAANITHMNPDVRRDAIRAVLRWVAVIPSEAPPICNADTSFKWVPSDEAGRVVFLSAWGTMHTAFLYRSRDQGQMKRICKLRPATASETIGTFCDLPDPRAFYDGLQRSYHGRKYEYLPEDVAPGFTRHGVGKVAEFDA